MDIINRCDGCVQCEDRSDEDNCQILKIPIGYHKELPPPKMRNENGSIKKNEIKLKISLVDIVDVEESKGFFR